MSLRAKTLAPLQFQVLEASEVEKKVLSQAFENEIVSSIPIPVKSLGHGILNQFCPNSSGIFIRKAINVLNRKNKQIDDLNRLKLQILKVMSIQRPQEDEDEEDEGGKTNGIETRPVPVHTRKIEEITNERLRLGEITPFEAAREKARFFEQSTENSIRNVAAEDEPTSSRNNYDVAKMASQSCATVHIYETDEKTSMYVPRKSFKNGDIEEKCPRSAEEIDRTNDQKVKVEDEAQPKAVKCPMCSQQVPLHRKNLSPDLAVNLHLEQDCPKFKGKSVIRKHAQKDCSGKRPFSSTNLPCRSFKDSDSQHQKQAKPQGSGRIVCPECSCTVAVRSGQVADEALAFHLNRCGKRPVRSAAKKDETFSYQDPEALCQNDEQCHISCPECGHAVKSQPQQPLDQALASHLLSCRRNVSVVQTSTSSRKNQIVEHQTLPQSKAYQGHISCPECGHAVKSQPQQPLDQALASHLLNCRRNVSVVQTSTSSRKNQIVEDQTLPQSKADQGQMDYHTVFTKGDSVEVIWGVDKHWYKGVVEAVNGNDTYSVLYEDDTLEPEVQKERMRPVPVNERQMLIQNTVVTEDDTLEAVLHKQQKSQKMDQVKSGLNGFNEKSRMDTTSQMDQVQVEAKTKAKPTCISKKRTKLRAGTKSSGVLVDDFDVVQYLQRIEEWNSIRHANDLREENGVDREKTGDATGVLVDSVVDASVVEDICLEGGLVIPKWIGRQLFAYQRTGIRWLWELYQQGAGGIIGDEMGLGKTVQACGFLQCLAGGGAHVHGCHSGFVSLVVCPASVIAHWLGTLRGWGPNLRVVVLHKAGMSYSSSISSGMSARRFIKTAIKPLAEPEHQFGAVILTTYQGLTSLKDYLLAVDWQYVILDEGQKIRNPDAEITLLVKQLKTVHRVLLTGTPIQNHLRELWSLFDFVFPGRLGTLPAFEAEFATPIRVGGYANASAFQHHLAYRCAVVLRDLINPYLLRRLKKDIEDAVKLPQKTEQVLFCRLTPYQRNLYRQFLMSDEVAAVLKGNIKAFGVISGLRSICNHPDIGLHPDDMATHNFIFKKPYSSDSDGEELLCTLPKKKKTDAAFGSSERSGKLQVLEFILPIWREQGHRVLLFSQSRRMLDILEQFVKKEDWEYGRLDGNTPVGQRQALVDRFNRDPSVFIMLLTTRAGGVGINLIGANRVILYDPDWNPMTDVQARERAWRLGQRRDVTVYRLICAGTIEEKIYHRQIFKTSLMNRVLQDPRGRNCVFRHSDLRDLFSLGDDGHKDGITETADLFGDEGSVQKESLPTNQALIRCKEVPLPNSRQNDENSEAEQQERRRGKKRKRQSGEKKHKKKDKPEMGEDDGHILKALFETAGLTGVFNQDFAEGSKSSIRELEAKADEAAKQALASLKQSRTRVQAERRVQENQFQPTWTGRHGEVAAMRSSSQQQQRFGNRRNPAHSAIFSDNNARSRRPGGEERKSFFSSSSGGIGGAASTQSRHSLSSQDILNRLQEQNQQDPQSQQRETSSASAGNSRQKVEQLSQRLHAFLLGQPDGEVTTNAIISVFKDVSHEDTAVFRSILRGMAKNRNGVWYLKHEYRQAGVM